MTRRPPPPSLQVRIEQAIAFGHSPDWMLEHLGATDLDIDQAMRRIDLCHAQKDGAA